MPAAKKKSAKIVKFKAVKGRALAVPVSEEQAYFAMIERAVRDPAVDVGKLERLLAIKPRAIYASAMAECQAEMEPVRRDCRNPQTKSRYASYEALDRALRPIYSRHGIALSFSTKPTETPETLMCVTCRVIHRSGHVENHELPIPMSTKGPQGKEMMTPTHAAMSAKTYGKRGLLDMIFNVATTDVEIDDDGNAAGGFVTINENERRDLEILIAETESDMTKVLEYAEVDSLASLPLSQLGKIKRALEDKRREMQKKKVSV
jgi:hypothetical protein